MNGRSEAYAPRRLYGGGPTAATLATRQHAGRIGSLGCVAGRTQHVNNGRLGVCTKRTANVTTSVATPFETPQPTPFGAAVSDACTTYTA